MKRQNIIILVIFIVIVFVFYLMSCNDSFADVEEHIEVINSKYASVVVLGEVYREGEYLVPSDWTLEQLFNYVGVKNAANLTTYNLTTFVADKMTYVVSSINSNNNNYNSKININTASKEELMTLKGVGEAIANRIIAYRQNNHFKSIEDIKNVSGIGDTMYEKIKNYITV